MPILGVVASSISGRLTVPSDYESIQSTLVTGTPSNISFTSIPSTYKALEIRVLWYQAVGDQSMFITYNGVSTGTSYFYRSIESNGSTASGSSSLSQPKWESFYDGNNAGSTTYEKVGIINITDYASTSKLKASKILWGADYNGVGKVVTGSCLFNSLSAITSVTFTPFSTNFAAGTRISLYGLK